MIKFYTINSKHSRVLLYLDNIIYSIIDMYTVYLIYGHYVVCTVDFYRRIINIINSISLILYIYN